MLSNSKIIQDISLLYELSLSIGESLDMYENAQQFLDTLMARKSLSYVSVWIKNALLHSELDAGYSSVYSSPSFISPASSIEEDHPIVRQFLENPTNTSFTLSRGAANYAAFNIGDDYYDGSCAVFQLEEIGFLKIHRSIDYDPFQNFELAQLNKVVKKFAISLKGCLAHQGAQQARLQIEENRKKLRQVLDTSPDAVIILDEQTIISDWNKQAYRLFGYKTEEAVGRRLLDFEMVRSVGALYGHSPSALLHSIREAAAQEEQIEIAGMDRTGKQFPVELRVSVFEMGKKTYYSLFVRDISNRKAAENELLTAKQAAENAQLAEQQFLASMSHEIRTPMNAVIGMTHLLNDTPLNEEQRDYLEALRFSADSLMGLLNSILDLSKIRAGEMEFDEHPFNLEMLMKSLQKAFQVKVSERPMTVILRFDPNIKHYLLGDRTRLNQIFLNLLGNSAKFTEAGSIVMQADLKEEKNGIYYIQFKIQDTGIGIPTDQLESVFGAFKQAGPKVSQQFGGSGLGLTIVKQLIELQGGSIEVESEVGLGTTFTFYLPFEIVHIDALHQGALPKEDALFGNTSLDQLEVLVAEDNLMNQKLIGKMLDRWDISWSLAENGQEALEQSLEKTFDIILMDLHMPIMDGVEASIEIRGNTQNPNQDTPIIALTAAALLEEKKRAFEAGINEFVVKPFSPKVLKKILEEKQSNK